MKIVTKFKAQVYLSSSKKEGHPKLSFGESEPVPFPSTVSRRFFHLQLASGELHNGTKTKHANCVAPSWKKCWRLPPRKKIGTYIILMPKQPPLLISESMPLVSRDQKQGHLPSTKRPKANLQLRFLLFKWLELWAATFSMPNISNSQFPIASCSLAWYSHRRHILPRTSLKQSLLSTLVPQEN